MLHFRGASYSVDFLKSWKDSCRAEFGSHGDGEVSFVESSRARAEQLLLRALIGRQMAGRIAVNG